MNRRELLTALSAIPALSLTEIPAGGEPLMFVLECKEMLSCESQRHIVESWNQATEGKPAAKIPFVVLEPGMSLKLLRKTDVESVKVEIGE